MIVLGSLIVSGRPHRQSVQRFRRFERLVLRQDQFSWIDWRVGCVGLLVLHDFRMVESAKCVEIHVELKGLTLRLTALCTRLLNDHLIAMAFCQSCDDRASVSRSDKSKINKLKQLLDKMFVAVIVGAPLPFFVAGHIRQPICSGAENNDS